MGKKPWQYRRDSRRYAGIWFDDGTMGGRYLWLKMPGKYQVHIAKLICKELNRAGVRASFNGFRWDVTERNGKPCAAKAKRSERKG